MAIRNFAATAVLLGTAVFGQGPPPRGFPGRPGGFPGPPGGMRQGDGVWHRNAYFGEIETFDSCFGHQPGNGEYHNHVEPVCLRAQLDDNLEIVRTGRTGSIYRERSSGWEHSPILGWSFDGYPIYGPYGYSDPHDAKSAVRRVRSSFRLRRISARDSIPEWAPFAGNRQHLETREQGPPINDQFPLGRYVEDYEYAAGLGDLDQYNGRFTVTPQFPKGTYAYFVTIDENGKPAFPFIFGLEYYGNVSGGRARSVPQDAQDYFTSGTTNAAPSGGDVLLKGWMTRNSGTLARAISGFDPSAGPQTTWPVKKPEGAHAAGGNPSPANADVQRIRNTDTAVYVNSNNLPSYVIGPWFDAGNGGVFLNFAAAQRTQVKIPREPEAAKDEHTRTPMGPVGIWVNGVAVFNALDGASYSHNMGNDAGGGLVMAGVVQISTASLEGGPAAPGSLVTAHADFGAKFSARDGNTVTIRDSAGVVHKAAISFASPGEIRYRVPTAVATGMARVSVESEKGSFPGELNIVPVYPGVFQSDAADMATAPVCQTDGAGRKTLVLYGSGFNGSKDVSVTIAGQRIQAVSAAAPGTHPGLDRITAVIPSSLAVKGKVEVVVTAGGKPSNPVYVMVN